MSKLGFNPTKLIPEDNRPKSKFPHDVTMNAVYLNFEDTITLFLNKLTFDRCDNCKDYCI